LAIELAGSVPMVWGAGVVGPVSAYRFACQLAENAKTPCVQGALPEAHHNQVVAFESALLSGDDGDFFRDRVDEPESTRLRLVVVHDDDGDDESKQRVSASVELAEAHALAVSRLTSSGTSAVERLASLVGLIDYATVYVALGAGVDPTPIAPIDELKSALRRESGALP
ncbi:MAG: mannose-6-phosphate isomerase, partial [Frankiales bacterium]|nr:mannose-6-phosphate isomerase [Frankiales bacterium]